MKKIVFLCVSFALFEDVLGQPKKEDSKDNQESYEQLKKEFEELRNKPTSREHFAWFARCEKNDECKQKTRENLKKMSHDELSEFLINGMVDFDNQCTRFEEFEKNLNQSVRDQAHQQFESDYKELYKEEFDTRIKNASMIYNKLGGALLLVNGTCLLASLRNSEPCWEILLSYGSGCILSFGAGLYMLFFK